MGVLKHAAASQNFHMGDFFFFITCQTCEPFVAQMSQNWMVAQWSVLGSIWQSCMSIKWTRNENLRRSSRNTPSYELIQQC